LHSVPGWPANVKNLGETLIWDSRKPRGKNGENIIILKTGEKGKATKSVKKISLKFFSL